MAGSIKSVDDTEEKNDQFEERPTLSDDAIHELKSARRVLRTNVTMAHRLLLTKCKTSKVTPELVDQWTQQLLNLDSQLAPVESDDDNDRSTSYYELIGAINTALDEELSIAAAQLTLSQSSQQITTSPQVPLSPSVTVTSTPIVSNVVTSPVNLVAQPQVLPNLPVPLPHYLYRPNDAKIKPFDGTCRGYSKFEKMFNSKYGQNIAYSDTDRFLKFQELVGVHGERFLENLDADAAGLLEAQSEMNEHFNNPVRIRQEVMDSIRKLPSITTKDILTSQDILTLEENIIAARKGLRILQSCNTSREYLNESLFNVITSKLPWSMVDDYYRTTSNRDTAELLESARIRLKSLEDMNQRIQDGSANCQATSAQTIPISSKGPNVNVHAMHPATSSNSSTCRLCKGSHLTIRCKSYDAKKRLEIAKQLKLCCRCLNTNHTGVNCSSTYTCPCGGEHSSVICIKFEMLRNQTHSVPNPASYTAPIAGTSQAIEVDSTDPTFNAVFPVERKPILKTTDDIPAGYYYQTVLVRVNGRTIRVMLDNGAGTSLVVNRLATELGLQINDHTSMNVRSPLGNGQKSLSSHSVSAIVEALDKSATAEVVFQVIPPLVNFHLDAIPAKTLWQLENLGHRISDVNSETADYYPVEMIIGLNAYSKVVNGAPKPITEQLSIQSTIFGLSLSGEVRKGSALPVPLLNFIMPEPEPDGNKVEIPQSSPTEEMSEQKSEVTPDIICEASYVAPASISQNSLSSDIECAESATSCDSSEQSRDAAASSQTTDKPTRLKKSRGQRSRKKKIPESFRDAVFLTIKLVLCLILIAIAFQIRLEPTGERHEFSKPWRMVPSSRTPDWCIKTWSPGIPSYRNMSEDEVSLRLMIAYSQRSYFRDKPEEVPLAQRPTIVVAQSVRGPFRIFPLLSLPPGGCSKLVCCVIYQMNCLSVLSVTFNPIACYTHNLPVTTHNL